MNSFIKSNVNQIRTQRNQFQNQIIKNKNDVASFSNLNIATL